VTCAADSCLSAKQGIDHRFFDALYGRQEQLIHDWMSVGDQPCRLQEYAAWSVRYSMSCGERENEITAAVVRNRAGPRQSKCATPGDASELSRVERRIRADDDHDRPAATSRFRNGRPARQQFANPDTIDKQLVRPTEVRQYQRPHVECLT
jgi:hypothetical protein